MATVATVIGGGLISAIVALLAGSTTPVRPRAVGLFWTVYGLGLIATAVAAVNVGGA